MAVQIVLLIALAASGLAGPQLSGATRVLALVVGVVLLVLGVALGSAGVIWQRRQLTALPRPVAGARLIEDGPYRLVRHPMYGGIVIASWGWAFATASLPAIFIAVVVAAFFNLKSRREEEWLTELYPEYPEYRARTRRLVPWLY